MGWCVLCRCMYVADAVIGVCAPEVRERFHMLCFEQCEEVGRFLNQSQLLTLLALPSCPSPVAACSCVSLFCSHVAVEGAPMNKHMKCIYSHRNAHIRSNHHQTQCGLFLKKHVMQVNAATYERARKEKQGTSSEAFPERLFRMPRYL